MINYENKIKKKKRKKRKELNIVLLTEKTGG